MVHGINPQTPPKVRDTADRLWVGWYCVYARDALYGAKPIALAYKLANINAN